MDVSTYHMQQQRLFSVNIAAGYPVLVYELPGTESPKSIAMDQGASVGGCQSTASERYP